MNAFSSHDGTKTRMSRLARVAISGMVVAVTFGMAIADGVADSPAPPVPETQATVKPIGFGISRITLQPRQTNAHRRSGRSTDRLLVWFLVLPLLSPGLSLADEGRDEPMADSAAVSHAKISEEQAKQAALKAVPGEVTDATVEKKRGKMVYVIEVVAQKDGVETDVLVDMDSGTVLGVER